MAVSPLNPLSARQPEILVVEDESVTALELRNRLTKLGYQVTDLASSGEQALRSFQRRRPDLVLMDFVLAGPMTGTETAKRMREQFDVPVVYLTAHSDPETMEEIKETGGHGFVIKPYQPPQLHAAIQIAIARHEAEQKQRDTDRSAWEETCQKSQDQMQQFTYAAGHDLQEPLRTASCFMELLARKASSKLDFDELEMLDHARSGLARMSVLLNDLLAFAQAGIAREAARESTSAEAALGWALDNLRVAIAESEAKITQDALPAVVAHSSQLAQVFQNLLGNAIKYRLSTRAPVIHVGFHQGDGELLFCVRDNGIGFEPKDAERIFAPFERLHSETEYPGTGIGLAICQKIIEAHGGRIWAESTPGEGAVFTFALPDRASGDVKSRVALIS